MFPGHFAVALAAKRAAWPHSLLTLAPWGAALAGWLLMAWAFWIDRHRAVRAPVGSAP